MEGKEDAEGKAWKETDGQTGRSRDVDRGGRKKWRNRYRWEKREKRNTRVDEAKGIEV